MSVDLGPHRKNNKITVPLTFRKQGGRKYVVSPDGAPAWSQRPRLDSTLAKAIARAFRWQRMLKNGRSSSIAELAATEQINSSYLARVLRLTLLAPDIIQAVLDGSAPAGLTLDCKMSVHGGDKIGHWSVGAMLMRAE